MEIPELSSIDSNLQVCSKNTVRSWIRGSLLGVGAYGQVNLALNRETSELFAVKSVICDRSRPSQEVIPQLMALEQELNILESLDSPHIVRCLGSDWSMENGSPVRNIFLEHMSGGSLADLLKIFGGRLDEHLARTYTRGILQGISYLHSREIVHCDIKGKNVLVGAAGIKLADLGAAKIDENRDWTANGFKGTPLWIAPEVARQEEQGPPSDIWSLGCTLVEMITGKPPWSDVVKPGSHRLVALYHIGCSNMVPETPASLSPIGKDFLHRCLQRNPRDRWTSSQLLQHPFVNEVGCLGSKTDHSPSSPCSTLDFPSSDGMETCMVSSVPILLLNKSSLCQIKDGEEKAPARKRIRVAGSESKSRCLPDVSPETGQWIVVHSPKTGSAVDFFSPIQSKLCKGERTILSK